MAILIRAREKACPAQKCRPVPNAMFSWRGRKMSNRSLPLWSCVAAFHSGCDYINALWQGSSIRPDHGRSWPPLLRQAS
jgi:hypothetical protein